MSVRTNLPKVSIEPNYRQKKLNLIAFLALWISIFIIGVYQMSKPIDTSASPYYRVCYNTHVGSEYNPRLEKRCRATWDMLTKRILDKRTYNSVCDLDAVPEDECVN